MLTKMVNYHFWVSLHGSSVATSPSTCTDDSLRPKFILDHPQDKKYHHI
jgi:hypothetical protein